MKKAEYASWKVENATNMASISEYYWKVLKSIENRW